MIPVITSTKTDKSAIDLAGVEAGAKIFVPREDGPFGSLAHTVAADQKKRSIARACNRTIEDLLNINISLLPFSIPTIRAIRLSKQACYQRDRHSHFSHGNRDEGKHSQT